MSNGKGDTRRPEDSAAIEANWDRIFAPRRFCSCNYEMQYTIGEVGHYWCCTKCWKTEPAK